MADEVGYIKRVCYRHHGELEISFRSVKISSKPIEQIAEVLNKDAEKREEKVIYYPATFAETKAHWNLLEKVSLLGLYRRPLWESL